MYQVPPEIGLRPPVWCILTIEGHPGVSPCVFSIDRDWRRSSKVEEVEETDTKYFVKTETGSIYILEKKDADVNLSHPVLKQIKSMAQTTCSDKFDEALIKR